MKNNRKLLTFAAICLLLAAVFALSVLAKPAEETYDYVYVNSETGDDHSSGMNAAEAVKTFTRACNLAKMSYADGVYIVITNAYSFPSTVKEVEHDVPFILTTKGQDHDFAEDGAKLTFGSTLRYYLNGDTSFKDITVEYTVSIVVVAQYHAITFDTGVNTVCLDESTYKGIYVLGGYQSPLDDFDNTLDSHVTVRSGKYYVVVGGSRQKGTGAAGTTYTGTNHITVEGGEIDTLLGASLANQISTSTEIIMTGGKVRQLSTGGDVTRRLEADATVTLSGGEVEILSVNNVVGAANVTLSGAKVGKTEVTYANTTIEESARKANQKKTLYYDAHYYTREEAAALGAPFDAVTNITRVYAKAGGTGTGKTESDPASFEDAFAKAAADNATVLLLGSVTLDSFTEPAHADAIRIEGADAKASLTVSGTYTLGGETTFSGLKLTVPTVDAKTGKFTAEKSVTLGAKTNIIGSASLFGGAYGAITDAGEIYIDGASVDSITGKGSAKIELITGKVGAIRSAETEIDSFALSISGGCVDTVTFAGIKKNLSFLWYGGSVGTFAVNGTSVTGKLTLGDGMDEKMLGDALALFTVAEDKVYFLRDGGTGNGSSVTAAGSSVEDAYKAMANGGTVVLCGEYTLGAAFVAPEHSGKVTFTSLYDGVDYRKTAGAKLILKGNLYCGGTTEFDHLKLVSQASYKGIMAVYHDMTVGADIECGFEGNNRTYPCLIGGSGTEVEGGKGTVTVNGGTWQRVRLGNSALTAKHGDLTMILNGGEIMERVYLSSNTTHNGDLTLIVNGGIIRAGISGTAMPEPPVGTEYTFTGNMAVELHGGCVYGTITPKATEFGKLNGTWSVSLYGGDFSHLTDIVGAEGIEGLTSTLYLADDIDLSAPLTGNYTFTNPIRSNGADPWLFFHDGAYYYIATGGTQLALYKAANLGDLANAAGTVIYKPETGHEWSANLWSPEIHYFTDEEIGAGNGGWYCFLGSDSGKDASGDNAGFGGQREYVIKCLDGDNLLGRWGNPVTGEVNVPEKVKFVNSNHNVEELCGGIDVIKVNGKKYFLFVTEVGRGTSDFYQTINITAFENPWTVTGVPTVICRSEYDWEMGGSEDGVHPKVVEGGTAVYGTDGSVYIVYSGSGYWTTKYQLGYLKYIGGDPTSASAWQKNPEPIFSKSEELNGCGHASYVTDTAGQGWICYHAYLGKDTASGRYAFVEPYTADANGVVIGDGSKHPASPSKTYTVPVNSTPLASKVSGFEKAETVASGKTVVKLTIGKNVGYINGVEKPLDAAPVIKNDRTMLPVRFVAEAFGAVVGWDGATSTATITGKDGRVISITIGASEATVNGEKVALDSPAYIDPASNRTYLPVRVVAEALGAAVEWDGATSTATLTK